ncbi:MAG: helix-turn-helix domain-containing protein [Pseudobdellovibrio sp.]
MKQDAKYKKKLKEFGLRVRAIRESKGWTLEETENHGWSNWQHLQKIESGKNITLATALKVADVFKIELSKILKDL